MLAWTVLLVAVAVKFNQAPHVAGTFMPGAKELYKAVCAGVNYELGWFTYEQY